MRWPLDCVRIIQFNRMDCRHSLMDGWDNNERRFDDSCWKVQFWLLEYKLVCSIIAKIKLSHFVEISLLDIIIATSFEIINPKLLVVSHSGFKHSVVLFTKIYPREPTTAMLRVAIAIWTRSSEEKQCIRGMQTNKVCNRIGATEVDSYFTSPISKTGYHQDLPSAIQPNISPWSN